MRVMKIATVLALIVLLVPPAHQKHNGESEADARARYGVIAKAIAVEAGSDETLGLFMLSVARHESTFTRKVHTGKTRGDGGRSWSLFQIMCGKRADSVVPGTRYRARQIVGTDYAATRRATRAVGVHLRKAIKACGGQPMCVFKRYGGVSQTEDPKVKARLEVRVKTYRRLVAERRKK